MAVTVKSLRALALAASLAATGLAGCASDGVELNGAIFEMMGVSSNTGAAKEPVMPQRAGLVLPPRGDALPVPGTDVAASNVAWPQDPEERKRQQGDAAKKQHAEYCEKALQQARVMNTPGPVDGPLGRCSPSALTMFGAADKLNNLQGSGERPR
jgi:hypothetical protein